jgi:hypothetical protein
MTAGDRTSWFPTWLFSLFFRSPPVCAHTHTLTLSKRTHDRSRPCIHLRRLSAPPSRYRARCPRRRCRPLRVPRSHTAPRYRADRRYPLSCRGLQRRRDVCVPCSRPRKPETSRSTIPLRFRW